MIFDTNDYSEQDKKNLFNFWKPIIEGNTINIGGAEFYVDELKSVIITDKNTGAKTICYGDIENENT